MQDESSGGVQPIDGARGQDAEGLAVSASCRSTSSVCTPRSLPESTTVPVIYTLSRSAGHSGSKCVREDEVSGVPGDAPDRGHRGVASRCCTRRPPAPRPSASSTSWWRVPRRRGDLRRDVACRRRAGVPSIDVDDVERRAAARRLPLDARLDTRQASWRLCGSTPSAQRWSSPSCIRRWGGDPRRSSLSSRWSKHALRTLDPLR